MENREGIQAGIGLEHPSDCLPAPIKRGGRPTRYTPELAEQICEEIAGTNKSILTICRELGVGRTTMFRWLKTHDEFREEYFFARWFRCENLAYECLAIADDGSKDYKEVKNRDGTTRVVLNKEVLARAAMRLKERHHLLAKYWPSKFAKTPAEVLELLGWPSGS